MNPFTRAWRYLRALFNGKLDELEDPEIILNEAVREMKEGNVQNRELAVQALTQKNNLQAEVDKEERLVAELERKATLSLTSGNRELAKQFLKEKSLHDATLVNMRTTLASAIEASEKVKIAMKSQEEMIRQKTSEAMMLKTNMKAAQIQIKINKALDGLQFSDTNQQWSSVQERITSMQSEASARGEIANTSIDSKMREMEMSQMDVEADRQLAELEAKLAIGGNPASKYSTTNNVTNLQTVGGGVTSNGNGARPAAPESDLDRQLRELEEKLGRK